MISFWAIDRGKRRKKKKKATGTIFVWYKTKTNGFVFLSFFRKSKMKTNERNLIVILKQVNQKVSNYYFQIKNQFESGVCFYLFVTKIHTRFRTKQQVTADFFLLKTTCFIFYSYFLFFFLKIRTLFRIWIRTWIRTKKKCKE